MSKGAFVSALAAIALVAAAALAGDSSIWPYVLVGTLAGAAIVLSQLSRERQRRHGRFRAKSADAAREAGERRTLERDRDRLSSILGAMSEGVVLLDEERRIQLANPSARALLRLPAIGGNTPDPDLDPPSGENGPPTLLDINRLPALHSLAARGLSGERAAEEVTFQNGRQVLVRTGPLRARGAPSAVLVFNDVTDLRRLEAVRRDLVANVSHELRTPLTAIRGYAETLQDGALNDRERAAEFIAIIHRHAERLSRLLDDLLELSRLEAGSRPLKREAIAIGPVVGRALDLIRPKAATRQLELNVELPQGPDEPNLLGDPEALEQVLVNLLDNAVKYTPPSGRVALRVAATGNGAEARVRIAVSDSGIGIESAQLPRVFERFYRVDSGRSREMGGTGLGLAIVKHLTQAMGGRVGVDSEIGKGSTFWLELPVAGANPGSVSGQLGQA